MIIVPRAMEKPEMLTSTAWVTNGREKDYVACCIDCFEVVAVCSKGKARKHSISGARGSQGNHKVNHTSLFRMAAPCMPRIHTVSFLRTYCFFLPPTEAVESSESTLNRRLKQAERFHYPVLSRDKAHSWKKGVGGTVPSIVQHAVAYEGMDGAVDFVVCVIETELDRSGM